MTKPAQPEFYEALLRDLVENLPLPIYWKDRHSTYLGCNTLFAKQAGCESPQELRGKSDFDLKWKAVAELQRSEDAFVMRYAAPKLGHEEPDVGIDGSIRWTRTSKFPLRDNDDKVIGVIGFADDITEQTQMREAEHRLERALALLCAATAKLMDADTEEQCLSGICRLLVEQGGYQVCWIGFPQGGSGNALRPAAHAGCEAGALAGWVGAGPVLGQVGLAAGVELNVSTPEYGYQTGMAVALAYKSELLGAISVYRGWPYAISEEEVKLLRVIAKHISLALLAQRSRNG